MKLTIHLMVTGGRCVFLWLVVHYENVVQVLKTEVFLPSTFAANEQGIVRLLS